MKQALLSVLTLVAAALLGGCMASPDPGASPPDTGGVIAGAARADPSPTAVPTTRPQLSGIPAREFARLWISSVNDATQHNNTDALKLMSGSQCRFCRAIGQAANERAARGSRIEGGELEIVSITPGLLICGGFCSTEVDVQAKEAPAAEVMADGSTHPVVADPDLHLRLDILFGGGRWWVVGVDARPGQVAPTEDGSL